LRRIKTRKLGSVEYEKFKDGLNTYVNRQGVESNLVNIPTIVTSLNEDGSISQEEVEPYVYEVINQNNEVSD
jgi:hypothetical protein